MFAAGARVIIGMDEVGRGALAGPVAVGVCAISAPDDFPEGLRDSKLLSAKRRVALEPLVRAWGACAVGDASAEEIDELGITRCLGLAGHRALVALHELGVPVADAVVLLDGKHDWLTPVLNSPLTVVTRIKADQDCGVVAGASVVAKVWRDDLMVSLAQQHPEFGWDGNKGYGAAVHMAAIATHGATDWHRRTWLHPRPEGASESGSSSASPDLALPDSRHAT
jgi:ribonuclease HII